MRIVLQTQGWSSALQFRHASIPWSHVHGTSIILAVLNLVCFEAAAAKYDEDLCLDAKNRYNGDKLANGNPVQAYTCEKGDNYNQNWKVI